MIPNPALSANRMKALSEWAVDYYSEQVDLYLKAAMQDGYLPMTEKMNALEERDSLRMQLPQIQATLAMPPDPSIEAQRSQAQQKYVRLTDLDLKYANS